MHRSKMNWPRLISLQLTTQSQDVVVDGACRGVVLIAPNFVEQFISRNNPSRILSQVLQSFELHGGKLYRLTVVARFHERKIHSCITEHQITFGALEFGWFGDFFKQLENR